MNSSLSIRIEFSDRYLNDNQPLISETFLKTSTWLHVCETFVSRRIRTRHVPWFIDKFIIGIHIPLKSTLLEWESQLSTYLIVSPFAIGHHIPYEDISYAIASERNNLKWPLWEQIEVDVFNYQAMGCFDNWRKRRGATQVHKRDNNELHNLIGLTNQSKVIKCCNIHQLFMYLFSNARENMVDPFFNHQLSKSKFQSIYKTNQQKKYVLPVWNLDNDSVSYPYHEAIKDFETWILSTPGFLIDQTESKTADEKSILYVTIASAYAEINNGKSLKDGIQKLQEIEDEMTRKNEEEKLKTYVDEIEQDKRTLIEIYRDTFIKFPHCDASVYYRAIKIRLTQHSFPQEQIVAVNKLHEAMKRKQNLYLDKRWILDVEKLNESYAEEKKLTESYISTIDWNNVSNVSDIIENDREKPDGYYSKRQKYQSIMDRVKDDDEEWEDYQKRQKLAIGECS